MGRRKKDSINGTENNENRNTTDTEGKNIGVTETDRREETEHNPIVVEVPVVDEETKKVRKKKNIENKTRLKYDEISPLLSLLFNGISLKFGDHWKITEDESTNICKPLCKIFDKCNISNKISNLSDGAGLVMATSIVIIPRVMISLHKNDKKVMIENGGLQNEIKKTTTNNITNNIENGTGTNITNTQNDVSHIKTFINESNFES
jgi:hypothetical protein